MSSIFAITILIIPTIYLANRTRIEFNEKINYTFGNIFLLILLTAYIGAIIYFGANWIDTSENQLFSSRYRPFIQFFITPGILVGIILYPKAFVDFMELNTLLTKTNSLESLFKIFGWFILTINVIINLATRSI